MPTIIEEERFYRNRIFDPYLSVMIWIASIIALFPVFIVLAYILHGDAGLMATTYILITGLVTIISSYFYAQTIGYDNFMEKYHNIVPREKKLVDYFYEKTQDFEYFKDLHHEFNLYFDELEPSIQEIAYEQHGKMKEALMAYRTVVDNITTGEEVKRLCNLLIPFDTTEFRGVLISDVSELSKGYYATKVKFQQEIDHMLKLLSKYERPEALELHN